MAYSSPATVVTATTITSTWGNSVKTATDYLANPPACRVYHNATQSFTNNTEATVAFNSERFKTVAGMHNTVTNNSRITISDAGLYIVGAHIEFASAADYNLAYAYFRVNAATTIGSQSVGDYDTADAVRLNPVTIWKFAAADYVEVRALQANAAAAARNIGASSSQQCEFFVTWIGLG